MTLRSGSGSGLWLLHGWEEGRPRNGVCIWGFSKIGDPSIVPE